MKKKFYITTAIPYVNAAPHVGHALEFVQADTIARYHKLLDEHVCLLSGGDENAVKNVQAAEKIGIPTQEFIDKNARLFVDLANKLNVQFDIFQKGSNQEHHFKASQKLWELCDKNGDIYKKSYEGLYCVGCEAFYTKDELNENGECQEHPGKKLELIKEENYFFKLSSYQQQLIELISNDTIHIVPEFRKNEILSFLKQPLQDISISRTNNRAKNWGVPVPGDPSQRIYVWFDALNIYQSGIGFGWDEEKYTQWWPADVHVIGKGITRFHAIYWPAFLLSAKLKLPKTLFVHGYFTVNGQKMSKTIGNVIDPFELIHKYGTDPLRYYFLREIPPFSDGDFSERRFKELYNADLANGLGNLVARVAKLCETIPQKFYSIQQINYIFNDDESKGILYESFEKQYKNAIENYQFNEALLSLWDQIKYLDTEINRIQPWTYEKVNTTQQEEIRIVLLNCVSKIKTIATYLQPFLPETAEKILEQFKGPTIQSQPPLFPRII
jgi:methionyl-tRNA synthetase